MTSLALRILVALLAAATVARAQGVSEQTLPPPSVLAPSHPGTTTSRTVPVVRPPAHPPRKRVSPHAQHHATAPHSSGKTPPAAASKPQAAKPAAAPPPPAAAAPPPVDTSKGSSTGLPLPRWVSLRSDDVNLRAGPGTQYPIDWVYHRRDYPVQVLREFEVWRLVQMQDGTKGWVHQATIAGRRSFLVQGREQVLRANPQDTADPVAKLEPGVIGLLRKCPVGSEWCEVRTGSYDGWLKRDALFGVSADETLP